MQRNTAEQRNYREGMQVLLDLDYSLRSHDKKKWHSEEIITKIAKLFYLTIPNYSLKSRYFQDNEYFLYQGKQIIKINVDEYEILKFRELMDFLYYIIKDNINDWVSITNITYEITNPSEINKESKEFLNKNSVHYKGNDNPRCEMIKPPDRDNNDSLSSYLNKKQFGLNESPSYYETFHVKIDLDRYPIEHELLFFSHDPVTDSHYGDTGTKISSPGLYFDESLRTVIRYIIIKYYYLFGSFKQIKACSYKKCEKIFFERRCGEQRFCSGKCRTNYNTEVDRKKGMRACRDRQNQWLRSKINRTDFHIYNDKKEEITPKPRHVQKKECADCKQRLKKEVASGQCIILVKNNKGIMKVIKELPDKRHRITRRETRSLHSSPKSTAIRLSHPKRRS